MLSLGSAAVAPLSPVAVGEDWIRWDEDRDGTGRSPRPFLEAAPSSGLDASLSIEPSGATLSVTVRAISEKKPPGELNL
jgi:hypothetical protein